MRLTLPLGIATLAFLAAPAAAQTVTDRYDPDPRIVIRETVRDAVTGGSIVKVARAYQGRDRGSEQTERLSRRVRVGRDGRVAIGNIAGNISVTGGSGDEVSIDAIKRARGDAGQLAAVRIVIDERPGRVEIRTEYERTNRSNNVSVDYTVTVPSGVALEVKSISGDVKVSGVHGPVRAESISGNVTTSATPRLEAAKSVSGDIDLTDAGADADLNASSVSGNVRAKGLKARALELGTISGDVVLSNVTCDRVGLKSVSGSLEYSGTLAKNGRYDVNTHSGTVRLVLSGDTGFELNANTFSGSIRSELPLTLPGRSDASRRGDRRRGLSDRTLHATFGDGSATLTIRTFSGDIVISKR